MPSNTLCVGNETPAGKKKAKERITILLCQRRWQKSEAVGYREIGPAKGTEAFY